MSAAEPEFTGEERASLTEIWDQLYQLYLERANGGRSGPEIEAEIESLIQRRDAIRAWGWNTGRNWKDDIPEPILDKLLRE